MELEHEKENVVGFAACWKLTEQGRCRLPKDHQDDCIGIPFAGDVVIIEDMSSHSPEV